MPLNELLTVLFCAPSLRKPRRWEWKGLELKEKLGNTLKEETEGLEEKVYLLATGPSSL